MAFKEQLSDTTNAVELTEQLVLVRTRTQDLESIKKLNCWGTSIGDVKIVRRMPNLEVCSLSVNKLTTLRDFAHCYNLKELYVRTNNIQCLGDIHYLKNLPKLRSLWLSENPCANSDNYRMTVLKALPKLQKLDNVVVTSDEVSRAVTEGQDLPIPEDFSYSAVFIDSTSSSTEDDRDGDKSSRSSSESSEKWALPRRKRHQKKRDDLIKERLSYEESCLMSVGSKGDAVATGEEEEMSPRTDESCADADDKDVGNEKAADDGAKSEFYFQVASIVVTDPIVQGEASDKNMNCNDETAARDSIIVDDLKRESPDLNCIYKSSSDTITQAPVAEIVNTVSTEEAVPIDSETEFGADCADGENSSSPLEKSFVSVNLTSTVLNETDNSSSPRCSGDPSISVADPPVTLTTMNVSTELNDLPYSSIDQKTPGNVDIKCLLLDRIRLDDSLNVSELSVDLKVGNSLVAVTSSSSLGLSKHLHSASVQSTMTAYFGKESKEPVNWEEYNRLRKEIGVKPIEPPLLTSRLNNSELTKTRNSNILQAVLSLVKELDKDSLDIVLNTVKARLDGL